MSVVIGAEAVDEKGPLKGETTSFVYRVVVGLYTEIDGECVYWSRSDTFCVPAWNHIIILVMTKFIYSDRPLLEKLGMFNREEISKQVNGTSCNEPS